MLVKDFVSEVAGAPFHEGMRYLRDLDYRASADQELVVRCDRAGLVIAGKTSTPELGAMPHTEPLAHGATRNPWDLDRSTGGSSGGSAAAAAAGMVPIAHANDGGGSNRIPAAWCRLVGLKPSRGRVPQGPLYGELMGGILAELAATRTVRDTAAFLDAVAGPEPGDPYAPHHPSARTSSSLATTHTKRSDASGTTAPPRVKPSQGTFKSCSMLSGAAESVSPALKA
jgi:amidase